MPCTVVHLGPLNSHSLAVFKIVSETMKRSLNTYHSVLFTVLLFYVAMNNSCLCLIAFIHILNQFARQGRRQVSLYFAATDFDNFFPEVRVIVCKI